MLNGCAQTQRSLQPNRSAQPSLRCPTTTYPCSAQPPSIPAVPNHHVSLQCPTAKSPCSAQPQVSLHCPTAKYSCSAQPLSILAVPHRKASLQCPTAEYPCSAQPPNIPAGPNRKVTLQQSIPAVAKRRVSLECPTAEYQYSCSACAVLQERHLRGGRETLHFLCNYGFRVGMLEVNSPHMLFSFFPPHNQ